MADPIIKPAADTSTTAAPVIPNAGAAGAGAAPGAKTPQAPKAPMSNQTKFRIGGGIAGGLALGGLGLMTPGKYKRFATILGLIGGGYLGQRFGGGVGAGIDADKQTLATNKKAITGLQSELGDTSRQLSDEKSSGAALQKKLEDAEDQFNSLKMRHDRLQQMTEGNDPARDAELQKIRMSMDSLRQEHSVTLAELAKARKKLSTGVTGVAADAQTLGNEAVRQGKEVIDTGKNIPGAVKQRGADIGTGIKNTLFPGSQSDPAMDMRIDPSMIQKKK